MVMNLAFHELPIATHRAHLRLRLLHNKLPMAKKCSYHAAIVKRLPHLSGVETVRVATSVMPAVSTLYYWVFLFSLLTQDPGLYYKLHGHHRPVTMKKAFIKRRKRVAPAQSGQTNEESQQPTPSISVSPNIPPATMPGTPHHHHPPTRNNIDPALNHQAEPYPEEADYRRSFPVDFTHYKPHVPADARQPQPVSSQEDKYTHEQQIEPMSKASNGDPMLPNDQQHTIDPVVTTQQSDAARAAKRKRKKDLEEQMKRMQAEMMELDDDGDA